MVSPRIWPGQKLMAPKLFWLVKMWPSNCCQNYVTTHAGATLTQNSCYTVALHDKFELIFYCHRAGLHWTIKSHSPSPPPMWDSGSGAMTSGVTLHPHPPSSTLGGSSGEFSHQCSEHTAQRTPTMTEGYGSSLLWVYMHLASRMSNKIPTIIGRD